MDLSVILVSYNTAETTLKALRHLFVSDHALEMEVVVVDNASKDGSAEAIARAYPDIPIVKNAVNVGFGRANNQALDLVKGRYLLLLNTDAFVGAQTIASTVGYMEQHPSCGVLGAKLVGGDGKLQPSCRYFPTPWNLFLMESGMGRFFKGVQMVDNMAWDHDSVRSCDWVPGCYYLVRREVVDRVGLFDPVFFMYCEEVDHCHATKKAGWEVTYFPEPVVHLGGESAKTEGDISKQGRQLAPLQIESEFIYFRKNMGLAGVVARLLLATTANAMGLIKNSVRLAPVSVLQSHFSQSWLTWRLFFSTHLGTRSSR
jgi:N-acetylglucosaminyl-diphospho-decaprenol L-rhamnosyltransferase